VFNKSGYARATRAAKTGFMQDSLAAAVVPRSLAWLESRCFGVGCRGNGITSSDGRDSGLTESALLRQLLETVLEMASRPRSQPLSHTVSTEPQDCMSAPTR